MYEFGTLEWQILILMPVSLKYLNAEISIAWYPWTVNLDFIIVTSTTWRLNILQYFLSMKFSTCQIQFGYIWVEPHLRFSRGDHSLSSLDGALHYVPTNKNNFVLPWCLMGYCTMNQLVGENLHPSLMLNGSLGYVISSWEDIHIMGKHLCMFGWEMEFRISI